MGMNRERQRDAGREQERTQARTKEPKMDLALQTRKLLQAFSHVPLQSPKRADVQPGRPDPPDAWESEGEKHLQRRETETTDII